MEQTRGSFREPKETVCVTGYKTGSFITSIVFLCMSLIVITVFLCIFIGFASKGAPENENIWHTIGFVLSSIGMLFYGYFTAVFAGVSSLIGFCFGRSAINRLKTKAMNLWAKISTYTNLVIVILTAIPTFCWMLFG
jgi:hypothetical protein